VLAVALRVLFRDVDVTHCPKVSGLTGLVSGFPELIMIWPHDDRGGVTESDDP
jgi:hypothetical protein